MRVALRRTAGFSMESVLSFLPYLLLGLGGVSIYDAIVRAAPWRAYVPGIVLLAGALLTVLAPRILQVTLTPAAIEVRVISGTRRFPYASLGRARIVEGRLIARLMGAGMAHYHTGVFMLTGEGRVRAYTSAFTGPFVLVERGNRRPLAFSPADPEGFLEAYDQARGA